MLILKFHDFSLWCCKSSPKYIATVEYITTAGLSFTKVSLFPYSTESFIFELASQLHSYCFFNISRMTLEGKLSNNVAPIQSLTLDDHYLVAGSRDRNVRVSINNHSLYSQGRRWIVDSRLFSYSDCSLKKQLELALIPGYIMFICTYVFCYTCAWY